LTNILFDRVGCFSNPGISLVLHRSFSTYSWILIRTTISIETSAFENIDYSVHYIVTCMAATSRCICYMWF